MQHLSEVAHIVQAALDQDEERIHDYTELLSAKLAEDGETRQAHILRSILHDIPQTMIGTSANAPMTRLEAAVTAVEQHRYAGFYDWHGIGELVDAAREVTAGVPATNLTYGKLPAPAKGRT